MATLKIEQTFELKLNRGSSISNYQQFIKELPKYKRWFLITYYYPNGNFKKSILTLENPKSELKKHLLNEEKFFISIKKHLSNYSLKKIQIEICK
ncbi:MAG: hypothetical protein K9I95_14120 [Flavobacteriaceae bacterium]|nr:hypothetical protein [Flavobacteriaceae bacterium]